MPPHCDSLDGPVVRAAAAALEAGNADLVLPFVPAAAATELAAAFAAALQARRHADARAFADRAFYETAVRLHRAGEGAPFTGLQPAGLDHGPVIPVAERALAAGDPEPLVALLTETVAHEVHARFAHVEHLARDRAVSVDAARAYTSAMLGLQVWAHALYSAAHATAHAEGAPAAAHAH